RVRAGRHALDQGELPGQQVSAELAHVVPATDGAGTDRAIPPGREHHPDSGAQVLEVVLDEALVSVAGRRQIAETFVPQGLFHSPLDRVVALSLRRLADANLVDVVAQDLF